MSFVFRFLTFLSVSILSIFFFFVADTQTERLTLGSMMVFVCFFGLTAAAILDKGKE